MGLSLVRLLALVGFILVDTRAPGPILPFRLLMEIDSGRTERMAAHDPRAEFARAVQSAPTGVWTKLRMVARREDGHEACVLMTDDVAVISRLAVPLAAALLVDMADVARRTAERAPIYGR